MATSADLAERRLGIDELDRHIVNLAARINASTYELLVLIREFDERASWLKWGLESGTQWLHWRCDLSLGAAREKVRTLVRVASPANECLLLNYAHSSTAARVEERCRQMDNTLPGAQEAANRNHARRSARVWQDAANGMMTLTVELPLEEGTLVCKALD